MNYGIVGRPGYCGNHASIKSTHTTIALARKAAKKHFYTDEQGTEKRPVCIIQTDKVKGDVVYWSGAGTPPAIIE